VSRGRLITIEGLDGAGKTTLIGGLSTALHERGRQVFVMREPGGVELSERIRALVKDPALSMEPRAEALLYAAARAQLVAEQLQPLLTAGEWVLLDRFVDSSLAYQGAGRGPAGRAGACRRPPRGRRPPRARAAGLLRRRRGGVRRAGGGRAGADRGPRRLVAAGRGRGGRRGGRRAAVVAPPARPSRSLPRRASRSPLRASHLAGVRRRVSTSWR
jgi:dTMP kinase